MGASNGDPGTTVPEEVSGDAAITGGALASRLPMSSGGDTGHTAQQGPLSVSHQRTSDGSPREGEK